MSLYNCPECRGLVSSEASACPHCGLPRDRIFAAKTPNRLPPIPTGQTCPNCRTDIQDWSCPSCGKNIEATLCGSCGSSLADAIREEPIAGANSNEARPEEAGREGHCPHCRSTLAEWNCPHCSFPLGEWACMACCSPFDEDEAEEVRNPAVSREPSSKATESLPLVSFRSTPPHSDSKVPPAATAPPTAHASDWYSKLHLIAGAAGILAFCLPTVEACGRPISAYRIAADYNSELFLLPILLGVVVICSLLALAKPTPGLFIAKGISGGLGLVYILMQAFRLSSRDGSSSAFKPLFGFYLGLCAFIAVAVLPWLALSVFPKKGGERDRREI